MIIAYTGLPGGGKSLSAISDYLLPELLKRRHVFCNISGLQPMLIGAHLDDPRDFRKRFTTPEVNRYLHRFHMAFDDDDARSRKEFRKRRDDGSWYYADPVGLTMLIDDVMQYDEATVVLDECHEYLCPENYRVIRPFLKYLSMARHYGHDIVLITQHITDIWQPLLNRVHETHDFDRGKLGLRTQYIERIYSGWNVNSKSARARNRFNDKRIYPLYSSHSNGAKEHLGYLSIWKNAKFVCFLALFLLVAVFSSYSLLRYGLFGRASEAIASVSASASEQAPEYRSDANVIYVKYVVCNAFDCKATRPDGSVLTLPLDYASGRYPLEVRKYVPQQNSSFGFGPAPQPGNRPGVPNAPR